MKSLSRSHTFLLLAAGLTVGACARSISAAPSHAVKAQAIDPGNNTLSYEPFVAEVNGWGPAERNRSNGEAAAGDGRTLTVAGKTYAHGFGVHAGSSLTFAIGGKCSTLTADIGIDDEVGDRGSVVFQVHGDGTKLYDSGTVTGGSAAKSINVNIAGKNELKLVVTDAGDGNVYDHADWAGAMLRGCGEAAAPAPPTAGPALAAAIRISAGGPARTVEGVPWEGCEAVDRCQGYVQGGFAHTEQPRPEITGAQSPADGTLYQSEWTGGQTNGVPEGGTAFSFRLPLESGSYQVRLHFAELNKDGPGQRRFDVNLEGRPALSSFDVFGEAGGKARAIVRDFPVTVTDGLLNIDFIRRVENAKVSGIEVWALAAAQPAALTAGPGRLVFSGAQGQASDPQEVVLRNGGGGALRLDRVRLGGQDPQDFELVSPPAFPLSLEPGQSLSLPVRLAPGGRVGALHATLTAEGEGRAVEVALGGLRAQGEQGDREPTLAQIVDALGYAVDVGGTGLLLGTGPAPIGSEVAAPLFERAGAGPVTLRPVARYSPDGAAPYGTFNLEGGAPRLQVRGTMAAGRPQTLNPPLLPGDTTGFDPGGAPFGVYLAANSYAARPVFTQDALNTGPLRHAVRVYPLRDRAGQPVPGSYLLGFEPAENGDYQDAVFVLENVRPVAAAALSWTPRADAPTTLYEGQGAAVNGELYVFGGFDRNLNNKPIATVRAQAYDPATDRWRRLRDVPEPLTHAGLAVDGGAIYLAGGFLGNHPGPQTDHVWKYDVASDTWSAMPALPAARGAGALVRLERELHFFGGTERTAGGQYLRDAADHWVLSLDGGTGWRPAAPLPNPRNHLSGVALGGLIYAVGGQHLGDERAGNQADVHVYDPASDTWRSVRSLPRPLSHATSSTLVWEGRLLVIGGVTQGERESAGVLEYTPASDTWAELTPLPGPRQSPVADVIGGQVVVVTGATEEGPTASVWTGQR